MTIEVTEDIIEGASISQSANGYTAVRVFKAVCSAGENMLAVLEHVDIPQYYDLFSGESGAPIIYALEINIVPEAEQNSIFRVTVEYSRPDISDNPPSEEESDVVIQVGSSVTSTKTQKDNGGNQMVISLTGQPDQVGDVDIQVPETVMVFERRESSSPLIKSVDFTGTVNSITLGGIYTARTLLCLGIDGVSDDLSDTWKVTYRFQYRPDTWDAIALYIDPETDRPHEDVNIEAAANSTNGWIQKEVYPEADFSTLNLPW